MMKLSSAGVALIKQFEGCSLNAYQCSAGVWTIGYGSTKPPVKPGDFITAEEAGRRLREDIAHFEAGVSALISHAEQREFDAFVSLAFNIGLQAFSRSSARRHHNAGNRQHAADSILLWNKAGGKILAGLKRRRSAERAHYLGIPG
jgi:GH24 family phage-related lysozyme (muramidase)